MRIPRSVRDLQVRWESLLLDFSTSRLFHGLGLLFGERRQELSLRAVVSDTVSSNGEGKCVRAYIGQALPLFSLAKILEDDFRLIFAYAVLVTLWPWQQIFGHKLRPHFQIASVLRSHSRSDSHQNSFLPE